MAKFKRTKPNNPRPEICEAPDCELPPMCVLGGYWFCAEHGNRDYEKTKQLPAKTRIDHAKEFEGVVRALRVIHTWARVGALDSEQVLKVSGRALDSLSPEND
jgi:hypothetical protein